MLGNASVWDNRNACLRLCHTDSQTARYMSMQDWLLMEEEFVANQERLKPQEERNQADRDKVHATCHGNGL